MANGSGQLPPVVPEVLRMSKCHWQVRRRLVTSTLVETPDVSLNSRMTDDHLHNMTVNQGKQL